MARVGFLLCAVLGLILSTAAVAAAEEALVLDNGGVLRGWVVREDNDVIVFRLAGLGSDNRVTVQRRHVTQRFLTADKNRYAAATRASQAPPEPALDLPSPLDLGLASLPPPPHAESAPPIPAAEPGAAEETFFERTARRAAMAFPHDAASRFLLVCMGIVVLLALVALGGRMAEATGLTLGKTTFLALLLGSFLTIDVVWRETLIRADHATFFLPLEILAWVSSTAMVLKCGFGRAFTLFAFVLVAGACVGFGAAAILILV